MKFTYALTAAAAATLLASGAYAQSSKFAATYDTDVRFAEVAIDGSDPSCAIIDNGADGVAGTDDDVLHCQAISGPVSEADIASLHVANWKEVLAGVSAQVNLVTFTQAKGRNGAGTSTSIAEGTVRAGVLVVPEGTDPACAAAFDAVDNEVGNPFAAPGPVTFASRRQELAVTVDLDVIDEDLSDGDLSTDLGIDGSVTVALGLNTTAAHHFNFVADDLRSGWYDVVACYDLSALAEVGGVIDADTAAHSYAAIGPRIVTVQEVRATKDGIVDETGGN